MKNPLSMKYIEKLTIRGRVVTFVSIALLLLLWTNFSSLPQLEKMFENIRTFYEYSHTVTNTVKDAKEIAYLQRRAMREYLFETNPKIREEILRTSQDYEVKFLAKMEIVNSRFLGDKIMIQDALKLYRQSLAYVKTEVEMDAAGDKTAAWEHTRDTNPGNPWMRLKEKMDEIASDAEKRAVNRYEDARSVYKIEVAHVFIFAFLSIIGLSIVSAIFARSLTVPLKSLKDGIVELSRGNLSFEIPFRDARNEFGEIARSLESLRQVALKESHDTWVKGEIARISGAVQKATNFKDFGNQLMSLLSPVMGAVYGAFYLDSDRNGIFSRAGGYACDDLSHGERFALGQGLVGQAGRDRKPLYIRLSPDAAVGITSGLGILSLQAVLIVPVIHRDVTLAVLEMGALEGFSDAKRGFIEALVSVIAMNIELLSGSLETEELLRQSREKGDSHAMSESRLAFARMELEESTAPQMKDNDIY